MTQSGARRQRQIDRRTTTATFVARLARTTDFSKARIFREVRSLGYSIGNDLGRAIINSAREVNLTARQNQAIGAFAIRIEGIQNLPQELGQALRQAVGDTFRRTRFSITVTASGTAQFVWGRSGVTEPKQAQVSDTQTFNIAGDQLQAFQDNLPNLLSVFLGRLEGKAANFIGADPKYGDYSIENPNINIDSIREIQ